MHRLVLVSFAIFALLSSAAWSADDARSQETQGAKIGAKPALRLPLASGEGEVNLRHYRGSLVLVHFRDPSSASAKEDLRSMTEVQERYGKRGLKIIGVIVAPDAADAPAASQSPAVGWPQARIASTAENSVLRDWLGEPPFDLPQWFLLAPDGAVIRRGTDAAQLEPAVRAGLSEHPPFKDLDAESTSELIRNGRVILLDVRTPAEFANGHLKGAVNIDIMRDDFSEAVSRLPEDREYVVYCKSGGRSTHACEIMSNLRFERLRNLQGGITAWQKAGLPVVGQD